MTTTEINTVLIVIGVIVVVTINYIYQPFNNK